MSQPTVAIVGRPNVGKSTLFNRIQGGRKAIVSAEAGTTRDRHFGEGEWNGRKFWLVDTGGLVPDSHAPMDQAIRHQVETAVDEADLILFVVDGKAGLHPIDGAIAERLRKSKRPVLVVVNKLDNLESATRSTTSTASAWATRSARSAGVGKGSGDLLDKIVAVAAGRARRSRPKRSRWRWWGGRTPANHRSSTSCWARIAMWWRRRPAPPATRSTRTSRKVGNTSRFIDTAGLRRARKGRRGHRVLLHAAHGARHRARRVSACWWWMRKLGLHNQDLRIATEAWEQGCGLIIR